MQGICFDIQRYSIHNGPGIRSTVFLKGCPLSCPWCHNREGLDPEPELVLEGERCVRCGACLSVCPHGGGEDAGEGLPHVPAACVRCGRCVEACAMEARRLVGRSMSVSEVVGKAERDRPFYEETHGGVTFSGGEPFMQPAFLLACLRACRERDLHTAVDTCGYAPKAVMLESMAFTDLYLYDLKSVDAGRHRALTGVPPRPITENLQALDEAGARIWVRLPLIPGINDDEMSLEGIGRFVAALSRTRRLHLLPYEHHGRGKGGRGARHQAGFTATPVPEETIDRAARRLGALGLEVHRGG